MKAVGLNILQYVHTVELEFLSLQYIAFNHANMSEAKRIYIAVIGKRCSERSYDHSLRIQVFTFRLVKSSKHIHFCKTHVAIG